MQDVVIIGSGPAGLSAALYMLRGGFSTTVIGKDNGALEKAEKIENYFGLERPLSGHELIENGRTQVQRLGGTLLQDEVVGISWNGNYLISTASTQIEARAIILTTGTSRKTMKIKNLAQLEGHGVSYCAVCDAFLYRGESVAVLGNGEYALHEVQELLPIVDSVTLLTNGLEPSVDFPPEVTIIQTPVLELVGTDALEAVCLEDGTQIHPACLFHGARHCKREAILHGNLVSGSKMNGSLSMNRWIPDSRAFLLQATVSAGSCRFPWQSVKERRPRFPVSNICGLKFLCNHNEIK